MFNQIILQYKPYFLDNFTFNSLDDDATEINYWLRERLSSRNTYVTYRVVVFRFYLWMKFNEIVLKDITRRHIFDYLEFMKNPNPDWCGVRCHFTNYDWRPFRQGLTSYSTNHNLQIIRQMFSDLTEFGYLPKNPFPKKINQASIVKDLPISRYLTKSEYKQIIKYVDELPESDVFAVNFKVRMKWLFTFLLYTACRRTELNKATMGDLFYKNNKLWFKVIGKGNKYGTVPVLSALEDELNKYRAFYGLPILAKRTKDESHIPIIIKIKQDDIYKGFHHTTIWHNIKFICNKLADSVADELLAKKLRNVSTHWFRHTSATLQVDAGIDLRIVQRNLRHSSIETTMLYQHVEQDHQHEETSAKFII